ncbi:hypothetical protein TcasGA2_TC002109, partial [Tribolium castaneum]
ADIDTVRATKTGREKSSDFPTTFLFRYGTGRVRMF